MTENEIDANHEHAENQHCGARDREDRPSLALRLCCCVESRVVHHFERRLVEVTLLVRVRIEEETLGATFHCSCEKRTTSTLQLEWFLQNATRFLEDRPDLRIVFLLFGRGFCLRGGGSFCSRFLCWSNRRRFGFRRFYDFLFRTRCFDWCGWLDDFSRLGWNRFRRSSGRRACGRQCGGAPLSRDVINHAEHECEDQTGKRRHHTTSL